MIEQSRSARGDDAGSQVPGARRTGWFSRPKLEVRCEDQEAEVRAQLYAKPAAPERTVRRVQRIQAPSRVEWIERPDRVEHDESPAPVAERIADRPAA